MTSTAEILAPWFDGAATLPKARAHQALGIGRDQLDAEIAAGRIAYCQIGKRQRFTLEQLAQWLDSRARTGVSGGRGAGRTGKPRGGRQCRSRSAAGSGTLNSSGTVYDFAALREKLDGAKPKR